MPRYFFETFDGDVHHGDPEGLSFADDDAARLEALDAFPDVAREKIPDGDYRMFRSLVRAENGRVVYYATMTLSGRRGKAEEMELYLTPTAGIA